MDGAYNLTAGPLPYAGEETNNDPGPIPAPIPWSGPLHQQGGLHFCLPMLSNLDGSGSFIATIYNSISGQFETRCCICLPNNSTRATRVHGGGPWMQPRDRPRGRRGGRRRRRRAAEAELRENNILNP